jgi:hypothetical protein
VHIKPANAKTRFGKLKIAHATFALALLAGVGGYGWHLYSLFRDAQVNMPQPQIEKLVKDLRLFHSQAKRFPRNFSEINELIWRTRPTPNYGAEGRQARAKNYYYFYTRVNDGQCAIWAIPLGPRRQDASAFFLVLTPDWLRVWKGEALEEASIPAIPAIPSADELTNLRMREITTEWRLALRR